MDTILAWYAEGTHLMGLVLFLVAVGGAFLAGYLVGRGSRSAEAPRPARTAPDPLADVPPLPALGGDEAQLMDLTAIRDEEAEPPRPLDLGPSPRR